MNPRALASELRAVIADYFPRQRCEVKVRGQRESALVGHDSVLLAAAQMARTSKASVAFGVASGVHEAEDSTWTFITCVSGLDSNTGLLLTRDSCEHTIDSCVVKYAIKCKCSILEALWAQRDLPSTHSVEALLTGNTETNTFFFVAKPMEAAAAELAKRAAARQSKKGSAAPASRPVSVPTVPPREADSAPFKFLHSHTGLGGGATKGYDIPPAGQNGPSAMPKSSEGNCDGRSGGVEKTEQQGDREAERWGNKAPAAYLHAGTGGGGSPAPAPRSEYQAAATLLAQLQRSSVASEDNDSNNNNSTFPFLKSGTGLGGGLGGGLGACADAPPINWDDSVEHFDEPAAPPPASDTRSVGWQFSSLRQFHR